MRFVPLIAVGLLPIVAAAQTDEWVRDDMADESLWLLRSNNLSTEAVGDQRWVVSKGDGPAYVVYFLPGRISEVEVDTLRATGATGDFSLAVSTDGKLFQPVSVGAVQLDNSFGWDYRLMASDQIPANATHLLVRFPDGSTAHRLSEVWIKFAWDDVLANSFLPKPAQTLTGQGEFPGETDEELEALLAALSQTANVGFAQPVPQSGYALPGESAFKVTEAAPPAAVSAEVPALESADESNSAEVADAIPDEMTLDPESPNSEEEDAKTSEEATATLEASVPTSQESVIAIDETNQAEVPEVVATVIDADTIEDPGMTTDVESAQALVDSTTAGDATTGLVAQPDASPATDPAPEIEQTVDSKVRGELVRTTTEPNAEVSDTIPSPIVEVTNETSPGEAVVSSSAILPLLESATPNETVAVNELPAPGVEELIVLPAVVESVAVVAHSDRQLDELNTAGSIAGLAESSEIPPMEASAKDPGLEETGSITEVEVERIAAIATQEIEPIQVSPAEVEPGPSEDALATPDEPAAEEPTVIEVVTDSPESAAVISVLIEPEARRDPIGSKTPEPELPSHPMVAMNEPVERNDQVRLSGPEEKHPAMDPEVEASSIKERDALARDSETVLESVVVGDQATPSIQFPQIERQEAEPLPQPMAALAAAGSIQEPDTVRVEAVSEPDPDASKEIALEPQAIMGEDTGSTVIKSSEAGSFTRSVAEIPNQGVPVESNGISARAQVDLPDAPSFAIATEAPAEIGEVKSESPRKFVPRRKRIGPRSK